MKKKLVFIIVLLTLGTVVFNTIGSAQSAPPDTTTASSFSVSPPSFEITANPGDKLSNTIKIENLSSFPLTISAKPENFVTYGDGGQVSLTDERTTYAIDTWITLDTDTQTVSPHTTALFSYALNIPTNTEPGSHYGAIVFSTSLAAEVAGANGASVLQQIGALILIKIPGNVIEAGAIDSFLPTNQYYTEPHVELDAVVENTGTIHYKPTGYIYVTDLFGNRVQTVQIDGKNVLPGSKRLFDQAFDFTRIGYYKADLELFYGTTSQVMRSETYFYAFNLGVLIPVLIGIALVILFYLLLRKRINKALKIIIKG